MVTLVLGGLSNNVRFLCVRELNPECGDGIVQMGELCDDGNQIDNDGCSNQCERARCGDGIVQFSETCDLGDDNNNGDYGGCNPDCSSAGFCGDGIQNGGEACDLGTAQNTGAYGGCNADCSLADYCGDSITNGAEQCDDGNNNDTDDCSSECEYYSNCGDGTVQFVEQCDDDGTYFFGSDHVCVEGEDCTYCDSQTCTLQQGVFECTYVKSDYPLIEWQGCPAGLHCNSNLTGCVGTRLQQTRDEAVAYCDNLVYAGHDDWILPTIDELRMLGSGCAAVAYGSASCDISQSCSYGEGYEDYSCDDTTCSGCGLNDGPSSIGCYMPPDYLMPVGSLFCPTYVSRTLKNITADNTLYAVTYGSANGIVSSGSPMAGTDGFICVRGTDRINGLDIDDACTLMGLNYNYATCPNDLACMNLGISDLNEAPVPALGVCKKTCFTDSNCVSEGGTCLIDGLVPGVGYCD